MRILYINQKENTELWIALMDKLYFTDKKLWELVSQHIFDIKQVKDYDKNG